MSDARDRLLPGWEPLDPPPGGLADLRLRIARHERRRKVRRAAGGLAAVGLLIASATVATWIGRSRRATSVLAGNLVAMRLGLAEPPSDPVTVPPHRRADTAITRLATHDEKVVYYLVGTR